MSDHPPTIEDLLTDPAWPGWEPCETCRATGWIPDEPDGWDVPDMSMSGCPDCTPPGGVGGLGFVPPDWQVEAAARAYMFEYEDRRPFPYLVDDEKWAEFWHGDEGGVEEERRAIRAALLAAAKAEREEQG